MLFMKQKKLTVLRVTALLLAAAFAIVVAACSGDEVGGIGGQTGTNQTPTVADYDISTNLIQTAGSVTAVTVTRKADKSPGAVTVKYNGSTTLPQTAGTYAVTFDVEAATGWDAANGLSAGTLVVNNLLTPSVDDYTITGTGEQTVGSVTAVTVTKKDNTKSPGAVTVYYEGTDGTSYTKNSTLPSVAGTFIVTFDVAAVTGSWNPATGLMAGTLIIDNQPINYASGTASLSWGVSTSASVLTLGLTPGKDTTEINLNWYSSGNTADKVAKVRFIRGTLAAGKELIEENGGTVVAVGTSSYTAHKVTVKGLRPGASYQYAVTSNDTDWSDAYDFKVPAATGAFKFAVIADPQLHTTSWDQFNRYTPTGGAKTAEGWKETMAKIVAAGVSFIASGGDQVDTTTNGNEAEYTDLFAPDGIKNLPLAPVSGNHDRHRLYNYHYNWPGQGAISSETPVDSVDAGRNYYYLYNNILFVVLDTAPYPNSTSAAAPFITKFKEVIEAAKAANTGKYDWLIVQHHKSTASVAVHLADTDIQYYVEAGFEKLMSDQNVDFVLAGHDHVYARSYPLQGKDGGQVSAPDKTKSSPDGHTVTNPGNPIYLTFTTGSGLKYYSVFVDKQFPYTSANPKLYVQNNTTYPYLGELVAADFSSTKKGSNDWLDGHEPVSNAAWVQPYIPSYSIAEVNGKTITFRTYPIATKSGQDTGATEAYSYNADTPYDWVTVTKN